jgi:predicted negative regulator of RcsB-dependent stress response
MTDEFLTDDEQMEVAKRWLAENGAWLLAGVVLAVALFFGYRYYEGHGAERDLRAGAEFDDMTAAIDKNDRGAARKIAAGLIATYAGTPYADQAQLTLARLDVDDGKDSDAVAPLTEVMQNSKDPELQSVARLRLARILIDAGKPDEAIGVLATPAAAAFAARFHEVRGDALYAKNDLTGAAAEYRAALAASDPRYGDAALLQLKISDLGVPPAPAATPLPDANKGKT